MVAKAEATFPERQLGLTEHSRGEGSSGTHMQGDDGMDLDISTEDMSE